MDDSSLTHPLADRARAALAAEPVPEGPSDEDIMGLMPQQMHEDLAAAARAMAGFDSPKAAMGAIRNILNCHAVHHARAVLALYGTHPAPVLVAIPAEQWHEDDGPCLWWKFPINEPPYSGSPLDSDWDGYYTHFTRLACPELPLPEAQS